MACAIVLFASVHFFILAHTDWCLSFQIVERTHLYCLAIFVCFVIAHITLYNYCSLLSNCNDFWCDLAVEEWKNGRDDLTANKARARPRRLTHRAMRTGGIHRQPHSDLDPQEHFSPPLDPF